MYNKTTPPHQTIVYKYTYVPDGMKLQLLKLCLLRITFTYEIILSLLFFTILRWGIGDAYCFLKKFVILSVTLW